MKKVNKEGAEVRQLYQALLKLESITECDEFLSDLCTIAEINALAQRLEVARLLKEGYTYDAIENTTGASTATISRIKRFLYHGNNGYKIILQRLSEQN